MSDPGKAWQDKTVFPDGHMDNGTGDAGHVCMVGGWERALATRGRTQGKCVPERDPEREGRIAI